MLILVLGRGWVLWGSTEPLKFPFVFQVERKACLWLIQFCRQARPA